jgi:thiamine kinase-like enzyme
MNIQTIKNIFTTYHLPEPHSFKKIAVGFTNKVYLVDDTYIIKVCNNEINEENIAREVYLYKLFSSHLPVPNIIVYDTSKNILNKHYVIYPSIEGDNLYNVWHTIGEDKRKQIVKDLCSHLRTINKTPYDDFVRTFNVDISKSWREIIIHKINASLEKLAKKNTLSKELILDINEFVKKYQGVLDEAKIAFVHWDVHFDNILVKEGKIVGMIDFERIEISSIDYVLDIVKRMQEFPSKYMSEYAEQFVKDEDYAHLVEWFREYAPELFEFDHLATRLDVYTLLHNLDTLIFFPEANELRDNIHKIINKP